ncbi:hypothetical protein ACVINY_004101 [Sinorhizobium meliloti]
MPPPLCRGGTSTAIAAPAFSPSDLELAVPPVDQKLRALVRALDAGPSEEVIALKERKMLTLKRNPSGKLRARDTAVIFEGQVSAGQIAIISGDNNSAVTAVTASQRSSATRPANRTTASSRCLPLIGRHNYGTLGGAAT